MPSTIDEIITQNTPIITDSVELFSLATERSSRYNILMPSPERFNEYFKSGNTIFRGPFISVWNASQQCEVYMSARGMDTRMEKGKTKKVVKVR